MTSSRSSRAASAYRSSRSHASSRAATPSARLVSPATYSAAPLQSASEGFLCPICREFVPASDRLSPQDKWAAYFKPNFLIRDIVEMYGRSKAHQQRPQRPVCSKHRSKALELYCNDCRAAVCDRCVSLDHRRCEHVVELAEAARRSQQAARQQQQTVTWLLRQLEARKRRCMMGRRDLERIERDIEARLEKEGQEVLRKVAEAVRMRKEALKREARENCKAGANVINTCLHECDEVANTLRALDRVLCGRLAADPLHLVGGQPGEEHINGSLQQLEQAVQRLETPCHFTVKLVIDDTAMTPILASLTLGKITNNVKEDGPEESTSSTLPVKSQRVSSAVSLPASGTLCSASSSSTHPSRPASQPSSRSFSQRGRVVSDSKLPALDRRALNPCSEDELSRPPPLPARRHSFTKTPVDSSDLTQPHLREPRRRKSQS
ncbi:uncharacterized protein LOC112556642 isoform X2 [Pomacea canaliculata]|uniref:uncharacterized protein LOC112556642 isoform X2 n=1 Tax=Pomacea canaliculata TaxID=400727 RepID=UPI000D73069B|nr:uncharacterized protein LOC112556642 isoform X2 [Pomacea canaliculata]XP_025081641.1 uncharacterized protein LOC112556642 isoform X2 [Pomacea canaliculata]